jgi:hypothetical protein
MIFTYRIKQTGEENITAKTDGFQKPTENYNVNNPFPWNLNKYTYMCFHYSELLRTPPHFAVFPVYTNIRTTSAKINDWICTAAGGKDLFPH